MYNFLKCMYNMGRLSPAELEKYVSAGWISREEFNEIVGVIL